MAIILPFLAALLLIVFSKQLENFRQIGWFVLVVPTILFLSVLQFIPRIKNGQVVTEEMQWIPAFNINFSFYIDGLSNIFGLLITGIGMLVVLYSIYYLSTEPSVTRFYIYLLLFM